MCDSPLTSQPHPNTRTPSPTSLCHGQPVLALGGDPAATVAVHQDVVGAARLQPRADARVARVGGALRVVIVRDVGLQGRGTGGQVVDVLESRARLSACPRFSVSASALFYPLLRRLCFAASSSRETSRNATCRLVGSSSKNSLVSKVEPQVLMSTSKVVATRNLYTTSGAEDCVSREQEVNSSTALGSWGLGAKKGRALCLLLPCGCWPQVQTAAREAAQAAAPKPPSPWARCCCCPVSSGQ